MWYENVWRRHLCDMHIDEWNPSFMASFNPEVYVNNLKKAKIKSAMIPVQSHVGLCYYPTKSGKMHNAFYGKEDMMKRTVDLCHKNGIYVTGYYSLIYNNYEHDRHPEWRMLDQNGKSLREQCVENNLDFAAKGVIRTGYCCPNNKEYREFVKKQIKEIIEYFTLDGLFFDMLFWPQLCYCDSCKERWKNEIGGEMPYFDHPDWHIHNQKRKDWMTDFAIWVANEVKKDNPNISVEHNFAGGLSPSGRCTDEHLNDACDYIGGDLYENPYRQSFACKFYKNLSKNQPFEYMFSRCEKNLGMHTTIKSFSHMTSNMFLTAANHGATLIIDAIDPVGSIDNRVYDEIGRVFEQIIPYEPYLNKGKMIEDVGIYYSSKKPVDSPSYYNHNSSLILAEGLIFNNILHGVIGNYSNFEDYKTIIASTLCEEDAYENDRLVDYVKNGGKLYISGSNNPDLLYSFFGAKCFGYTKESVVYIAPNDKIADDFGRFNKKYPLHFDGSAPIIEGFNSEDVIAFIVLPYTKQDEPRFASIHSNPPGIETNHPAMLKKKFGKGTVLWSAVALEAVPELTYKHIFCSMLKNILNIEQTVVSDAPYDVEITAFKDGNNIYINTVLLNENDRIRKSENFTVKVKMPNTPSEIRSISSGKVIPFQYENGTLIFEVSDMEIFSMYIIK